MLLKTYFLLIEYHGHKIPMFEFTLNLHVNCIWFLIQEYAEEMSSHFAPVKYLLVAFIRTAWK